MMNFVKWNVSLSRRLKLGFTSVLLLLLCVATVGVWSLRKAGNDMTTVVEVNALRSSLASELMINIGNMATTVRTIALLSDLQAIDKAFVELKQYDTEVERLEGLLRRDFEQGGATHDELTLFGKVVGSSRSTRVEIAAAAQLGKDGDNIAAVSKITTRVVPSEQLWRSQVMEFVELQKRRSAQVVATSMSSQHRVIFIQLVLVILALSVGGLIAWRITRSVVQPIGHAMRVAERIAQGDLTSAVEVGSKDETGRLLDAISVMQDKLRSLVGDISMAANSIESSSAEVASATMDLSRRTETASHNLQIASSSLSQLSTGVSHSAEAARNANLLATAASDTATRSGEVVHRVVNTMEDISVSSKKIADIISVIDGIAFQTNILALNAAVEAARAGEQGRGFAVVASEVRSLAGRAAASAKEIKNLIGNSTERVEAGRELVSQAGKIIQKLVQSVKDVSSIVSEISTATEEQNHSIASITQSVSTLDDTIQQNAAMVEQSAGASESLKEQASNLSRMVGVFRFERVLADRMLTIK